MYRVIKAAIQSYQAFYKSNEQVSKKLFLEMLHLSKLSEAEKSKMKFYIGQGLLVQLWYETLKSTKSNLTKLDIARISAWTPFYDNLMDDQNFSHHQIMESIESENSNKTIEHFQYLFHHSYQTISNKEQVLSFFEKVGTSQNDSLKQKDSILQLNETIEITRAKGGWATCFYTSANGQLNKQEIEFFYEVGACLQLCNDIFDVYKDHQEGIKTLPISDILLTSELYTKWTDNAKRLLRNTTASNQSKALLWKQLMLIFSRGQIALTLLLKLKVNDSNKLNFSILKREQLICDMEKSKNIWHSFMLTRKNKMVSSI